MEQTNRDLEEKLKQLENVDNQYRNLVDSTSDSLYLVDRRCRYLFLNNNHLQLLNLPKDRIIGHSYAEFHSSLQSQEFVEMINEVFTSGRSLQDEHTNNTGDSHFLRTFSPVRDSGNPDKVIAVAIASKDVTERRQTEKALLQSEEKYRLLVEYSSDAIFTIQAGRIIFANRRFERMLGYVGDEFPQIFFPDLVLPEDRALFDECQLSTLAGENENMNYSFRIIDKSGSTRWVDTDSVAIDWDDHPATLNFMRDTTRQKKTEARLYQAQKMEAIGTLAGGIAHDFNNLLMGIQGHASLALLDIDAQNPIYENLKTIESLVVSGADLTRQLLGFARGGKYEVMTVNLNELIFKTSESIGRTRKEISIHHTLADDLWLADVDPGQIERVLLNLYVNAWQAMPGGGELYLATANIVVDETGSKNNFYKKKGPYVKISITDTGVGMDEKTRERIFEPFFTTKEMGRGTGLGLATAYGIIKNHNGFINVYSEKGQGTTFTIYLPASPNKDVAKPEFPETDEISGGTETILLVDDEAIILSVAKELLEALGYAVLTAGDGRAAVELYKKLKGTIDLVILDMVMPGMNGGETFDELKKINPGIKVLLSSGYSLNGQASKIMGRGCVGFLQKPFTFRDIALQLRKVFDEKSIN